MSLKATDKHLMPPPLPRLKPAKPRSKPAKPKISSRTSNASIALLSLNPPIKPVKPNKVTHYQIQVKQMLMENVRMHSMSYVDPLYPLGSLELVRKLLLVAQTF